VDYCFSFFFQAEDGIRAFHVTGVQTCALPIWPPRRDHLQRLAAGDARRGGRPVPDVPDIGAGGDRGAARGNFFGRSSAGYAAARSEERRVGKECRYRWYGERYNTDKST